MPEKFRKIVAALMVTTGIIQLYSFLSAVYGYFYSDAEYSFVWNYWVIGGLAILLIVMGVLLLRQAKWRVFSLLALLLFLGYQGFSVGYYQIRPLVEGQIPEGYPFDFSGASIFLLALILFVLLLFGKKFPSKAAAEDEKWKTKWRLASGLFALIGAGCAIAVGVLIILHFKQSGDDIYFITNEFDAVIAFSAAVFLLAAVVFSFKRTFYLLAGITLAFSFLYLNNYYWSEQIVRFTKEIAQSVSVKEFQLFGLQLIIGVSAFISGLFQLISHSTKEK
ncbi:hypothetical protein [Listeria costaricensis]|uniref:hypothetical protein n=1 Tax=Listeria costaricensis TaxID=2026604 RepID=UPI000C08054B|nr:hypothetical protein [Listeria costaricensis]